MSNNFSTSPFHTGAFCDIEVEAQHISSKEDKKNVQKYHRIFLATDPIMRTEINEDTKHITLPLTSIEINQYFMWIYQHAFNVYSQPPPLKDIDITKTSALIHILLFLLVDTQGEGFDHPFVTRICEEIISRLGKKWKYSAALMSCIKQLKRRNLSDYATKLLDLIFVSKDLLSLYNRMEQLIITEDERIAFSLSFFEIIAKDDLQTRPVRLLLLNKYQQKFRGQYLPTESQFKEIIDGQEENCCVILLRFLLTHGYTIPCDLFTLKEEIVVNVQIQKKKEDENENINNNNTQIQQKEGKKIISNIINNKDIPWFYELKVKCNILELYVPLGEKGDNTEEWITYVSRYGKVLLYSVNKNQKRINNKIISLTFNSHDTAASVKERIHEDLYNILNPSTA